MKSKVKNNSLLKKIVNIFAFKEISIKALLTIVILFFFLFLSTILITIIYQGNRLIAFKEAYVVMDEIVNQVETQFTLYFEPSIRTISNFKYVAGKYEFIDPIKEKELLEYFRNILLSNPEIASMYYGTQSGEFYMARRVNDGSVSFRLVKRDNNQVKTTWQHENPSFTTIFPDTVQPLATGYDPTKRVWYKETILRNGFNWSKPYVFFTDKLVGITVSDIVKDNNGSVIGVVAIDYSLLDMSIFLNTLSIAQYAKIFVTSEDNDLLAISGYSRLDTVNYLFKQEERNGILEADLIKPTEVKDNPDINDFFNKFQSQVNSDNLSYFEKLQRFLLSKVLDNFSFSEDQFLTFFDGEGGSKLAIFRGALPHFLFPIKIGIIYPEDIILGATNRIILSFVIIVIFFTLLILFFTLKFANLLSEQLFNITDKINKIKNFDLEFSDLSALSKGGGIFEINQINDSYESMRKSLVSFGKFVPQNVVKQLVQKDKEAELGGEKKELTILFSDIENFTSLIEEKSQIVLNNIGDYFDIINNKINEYYGVVDKFIGDSVMAFWSKAEKNIDRDILACECAILIQSTLKEFNHNLKKNHGIEFLTRFGINTGEALVGNLGAAKRLNYSAIGDSVNLASRIEGLNKLYRTGILISESTYIRVKHKIICRPIDNVLVKGKNKNVLIYQPIDLENNLSSEDFDFIKTYEAAFELYQNADWARAKVLFLNALALKQNDFPCQLLIQRCDTLIQNPVGNWSGIFERRARK